MKKSAYQMKNSMLKMAAKGAPMQMNYGKSPLQEDEKDKIKKGMENMTNDEISDVAKRNIEKGVRLIDVRNPKIKNSRTDSVRSAIEILHTRKNKEK